jgi:hypothetical protein
MPVLVLVSALCLSSPCLLCTCLSSSCLSSPCPSSSCSRVRNRIPEPLHQGGQPSSSSASVIRPRHDHHLNQQPGMCPRVLSNKVERVSQALEERALPPARPIPMPVIPSRQNHRQIRVLGPTLTRTPARASPLLPPTPLPCGPRPLARTAACT